MHSVDHLPDRSPSKPGSSVGSGIKSPASFMEETDFQKVRPGNDKLDGSSGTDTAMNCGELEHKSTEIPPDGGCPPNYET